MKDELEYRNNHLMTVIESERHTKWKLEEFAEEQRKELEALRKEVCKENYHNKIMHCSEIQISEQRNSSNTYVMKSTREMLLPSFRFLQWFLKKWMKLWKSTKPLQTTMKYKKSKKYEFIVKFETLTA